VDEQAQEAVRLTRRAAELTRQARGWRRAGRVYEAAELRREAIALHDRAVRIWAHVLARYREATGYDSREEIRGVIDGMRGDAGE
jgi:hypothetical protein